MSDAVSVIAHKTRHFHAGESLGDFIVESLERPEEGAILAVTSKIVSLAEERLVAKDSVGKKELIQNEADVFLGEIAHSSFLTIKHGLMIPSAGVDESNSESGDYILFPRDPYASAKNLWLELRKRWGRRDLGILMTDSHTSPLRRGVTGIGLSYWGFKGIRDMVGIEDLFGRPLRMTRMNLVDGLAAVAVMMMGEGPESQPLATITGAGVEFGEECDHELLKMPLEEDLYYPILKPLIK